MNNNVPVILQVLPRLEQGGVERGTIEVATALREAGWEPIVVSGGGRMVYELTKQGIRHITLPVYSKNPLTIRRNATLLANVIKEYNARAGLVGQKSGRNDGRSVPDVFPRRLQHRTFQAQEAV